MCTVEAFVNLPFMNSSSLLGRGGGGNKAVSELAYSLDYLLISLVFEVLTKSTNK